MRKAGTNVIQHHVIQSTSRGPMAARLEPAIDRFGLFLIVAVCLAADRLPKKNSSRPIDRAIGHAAAVVIAAVGLVGRLIDRLSNAERVRDDSASLRTDVRGVRL